MFRRDLRLNDNPALTEAAHSGRPVLPVLAWQEADANVWDPGAVFRAWQLANAQALDQSLRRRYGSGLLVRSGPPDRVLRDLQAEVRAEAVYLNAGHDPPALAEELAIQRTATELGMDWRIQPGNVLLPLGAVLNQQGRAFRVFSPYHRRFMQRYRHTAPLPAPERLTAMATSVDSVPELNLAGEKDKAAQTVTAHWPAGEQAARAALREFIRQSLEYYGSDRHSLEISGTSRISAWLAAGVISVRSIWDEVTQAVARDPGLAEGAQAFLRQLVWREFCCQVLDEFPTLPDEPLQEKFRAFPWDDNADALQAWREGRTGYPVVDAAMRQLLQEGWMPGRARMVVGSFLVKHLLQPWQLGEAWFRERLIDYDLALNSFNWQWVAGSGADAAPYFRIFNPILQGQRFDADGSYVREWLPELAGLPDRHIHSPWTASAPELQAAGLRLGDNYPAPVVEHRFARARALDALKSCTARSASA